MSKPPAFHPLTRFVAAIAGRNMSKTAYAGVVIGVGAMVLLTLNPTDAAAHRWLDAECRK